MHKTVEENYNNTKLFVNQFETTAKQCNLIKIVQIIRKMCKNLYLNQFIANISHSIPIF